MTLIPWLLAGEVILLAGGLMVHHHLHHSRAAQVWALSRLVSEVFRSVRAAGAVHVYLDYLFALPFPAGIRSLLRTLNVIHLRSTRPLRHEAWEPKRDDYVANRLTDTKHGQLNFYQRALRKATKRLSVARKTFYICALLAVAATLSKWFVVCHWIPMAEKVEGTWATVLGALAIVMPVLAVAALSLAASFDLEALVHTYDETLRFLAKQECRLKGAASEREFTKLGGHKADPRRRAHFGKQAQSPFDFLPESAGTRWGQGLTAAEQRTAVAGRTGSPLGLSGHSWRPPGISIFTRRPAELRLSCSDERGFQITIISELLSAGRMADASGIQRTPTRRASRLH